MEERKVAEKEHYDRKAGEQQALIAGNLPVTNGPAAIEPYLRPPYDAYAAAVAAAAPTDGVVVDVGAGTGIHSLLAARPGVLVVPSDISSAALGVAVARARQAHQAIAPVAADAERLPVRDHCADLVTSAGLLYCLDVERFADEVARVLRPGGSWVLVDSFNHNPVYRLNRWLGMRTGRRTRRAYTHIPDTRTLDVLRARFGDVSVRYFGVWSFLWPAARRLLGDRRATHLLVALEPPTLLRRFAFKIVVTARTPRTPPPGVGRGAPLGT